MEIPQTIFLFCFEMDPAKELTHILSCTRVVVFLHKYLSLSLSLKAVPVQATPAGEHRKQSFIMHGGPGYFGMVLGGGIKKALYCMAVCGGSALRIGCLPDFLWFKHVKWTTLLEGWVSVFPQFLWLSYLFSEHLITYEVRCAGSVHEHNLLSEW